MADYTVNYSPTVYEVYVSDGGARTYTDSADAAHNADAGAHAATAHTWTAGQTFEADTEQDGKITIKQGGQYRGAIEFDTAGALVASPWIISTVTLTALSGHDNVLLTSYNGRFNQTTQSWERINSNEHVIDYAMESRWSPVDPIANRGQFEWYLRLDTDLSGAVVFDRQPFNMVYNFDLNTSAFSFGDTGRVDTGNTFHFYDGGVSGGVVLHNTSLTIRGATETDRILFVMTSSADVAQISAYDEVAAKYMQGFLTFGGLLKFDVQLTDGASYYRFDVQGNRIASINASGIGVFTTFPARALDVYGQSIVRNSTTTTSAVLEVDRLEARVSTASTGGAAGFGPALDFAAETATDATYQQQARIKSIWHEAADATRKSDLVLSAYDTAEREGLRIRGAGSAAGIGFFGSDPAAKPTGVAVTAEGIHAALVTLGLISA